MTCRIPSKELKHLATEFVDQTVEKVGTNEELAISTTCLVKQAGCISEFNDLLKSKTRLTLPSILHNELSDVDLSAAEDCMRLGRNTYQGHRSDYLFEGALDLFDASSTGGKIGLGLAVVGGVILAVAAAPIVASSTAGIAAVNLCAAVAPVIAAAGVVGFVVEGGRILKNAAEIVFDNNDDAAIKQDLREMGQAGSGFALSAFALRPSLLILRETFPGGGSTLALGHLAHVQSHGHRGPTNLAPTTKAAPAVAAEPAPPAAVPTSPAATTPAPAAEPVVAPVVAPERPSFVSTLISHQLQEGEVPSEFFAGRIYRTDGRGVSMFFYDAKKGIVYDVVEGTIEGDIIVSASAEDQVQIATLVNYACKQSDPPPLRAMEGVSRIDVKEKPGYTADQFRDARDGIVRTPPRHPDTPPAPGVN